MTGTLKTTGKTFYLLNTQEKNEAKLLIVLPLSAVLLSKIVVTCSQPRSKNIKWKILERNNF